MSSNAKRSKRLTIPLSDPEYLSVKQRACSSGMAIAAYSRSILLRPVAAPRLEERQLAQQIGQLASEVRRLNSDAIGDRDTKETLEAIQSELAQIHHLLLSGEQIETDEPS